MCELNKREFVARGRGLNSFWRSNSIDGKKNRGQIEARGIEEVVEEHRTYISCRKKIAEGGQGVGHTIKRYTYIGRRCDHLVHIIALNPK